MAVKNILQIGNDALRLKSEAVDFETDTVGSYIDDLSDTLRAFQVEKKIGRAIAGPQIGLLKRIIRMESQGRTITMINPEIEVKSNETFDVWDSCFSADAAFFGLTRRHRSITVHYRDGNGKEILETFTDGLSELFQHEIDHLDGILFTDRIIHNKIIMRQEWEKLQ